MQNVCDLIYDVPNANFGLLLMLTSSWNIICFSALSRVSQKLYVTPILTKRLGCRSDV